MIQPPTHELGHNVGTPVSSNTVLEKIRFKGSRSRHSSHNARPHYDNCMCHKVAQLGHRAQRWWRADIMPFSKVHFEAFQIWWILLDDGSSTSTNLGNDHGFISEEY